MEHYSSENIQEFCLQAGKHACYWFCLLRAAGYDLYDFRSIIEEYEYDRQHCLLDRDFFVCNPVEILNHIGFDCERIEKIPRSLYDHVDQKQIKLVIGCWMCNNVTHFTVLDPYTLEIIYDPMGVGVSNTVKKGELHSLRVFT